MGEAIAAISQYLDENRTGSRERMVSEIADVAVVMGSIKALESLGREVLSRTVIRYDDLQRRIDAGEFDPAVKCRRCEGCGQIANSKDGEAWTAWAELSPGSDFAVRVGIVKPIACPACEGAG